jgi:hypothetical protein
MSLSSTSSTVPRYAGGGAEVGGTATGSGRTVAMLCASAS